MRSSNPQRKLRNLLLDKRFQLKYTLAVVLVSSVISAGLGFFLYQAHRESSRVSALGDDVLDRTIREGLATEDRQVIINLVLFLGGLVICLTGLGVVATHKIAGPAYSLSRMLEQIAEGNLQASRKLRRGDELQQVADAFSRMLESLQRHEGEELEAIEHLLAALRADPQTVPSAMEQLEALLRVKRQRLGIEDPTSSKS